MPFWEYPLNKERIPLSSVDPDDDDDGDEGEDLPPYRDVPLAQSTDGGSRTNGRKKTKKKSAHKAITIEEDSSFAKDDNANNYGGNTITVTTATTSLKFYNDGDDDDDDDGGFGEGDYYSKKFGGSGAKRYNGLMTSSLRGSRQKKYRGLLIWAYIKYFLSCRWMCDSSGSSGGGCFSKMTRAMWLLFYLFLLAIIMTCAIAIGFIIAQEGNPFAEDEALAAQTRAQGTGSGINANADAISGNSGGGGNSLLPNLSKPLTLPPPPDNLYELCDDWITKSGRDACSNACNVADCCTYPDGDRKNCRDGQEEVCAKYRVACMAMELHMEEQAEEGSDFYENGKVDDNFDDNGSVDDDYDDGVLEGTIALYKPPSYLEQICSSTSLQTPQGFDSCSKACKPSRCCNPEKYGCDVDDYLYCELYKKPCMVVEESWRGSGHAVVSGSARDDDDDDHGGNPFHSGGVGKSNNDDDGNDDDDGTDDDGDYDSAIANTVMSACNSAK